MGYEDIRINVRSKARGINATLFTETFNDFVMQMTEPIDEIEIDEVHVTTEPRYLYTSVSIRFIAPLQVTHAEQWITRATKQFVARYNGGKQSWGVCSLREVRKGRENRVHRTTKVRGVFQSKLTLVNVHYAHIRFTHQSYQLNLI